MHPLCPPFARRPALPKPPPPTASTLQKITSGTVATIINARLQTERRDSIAKTVVTASRPQNCGCRCTAATSRQIGIVPFGIHQRGPRCTTSISSNPWQITRVDVTESIRNGSVKSSAKFPSGMQNANSAIGKKLTHMVRLPQTKPINPVHSQKQCDHRNPRLLPQKAKDMNQQSQGHHRQCRPPNTRDGSSQFPPLHPEQSATPQMGSSSLACNPSPAVPGIDRATQTTKARGPEIERTDPDMN
jgi:hypothetical protein